MQVRRIECIVPPRLTNQVARRWQLVMTVSRWLAAVAGHTLACVQRVCTTVSGPPSAGSGKILTSSDNCSCLRPLVRGYLADSTFRSINQFRFDRRVPAVDGPNGSISTRSPTLTSGTFDETTGARNVRPSSSTIRQHVSSRSITTPTFRYSARAGMWTLARRIRQRHQVRKSASMFFTVYP